MSRYASMPHQDYRIEMFVAEAPHLLNIYRHLAADLETLAVDYARHARRYMTGARQGFLVELYNRRVDRFIGHRYGDLTELHGILRDRIARVDMALSAIACSGLEGLPARRERAQERIAEAWVALKSLC